MAPGLLARILLAGVTPGVLALELVAARAPGRPLTGRRQPDRMRPAGRQDPVRGRDGCPGRHQPGTRTQRQPARPPRLAGPTPTGSRRLTSARPPSGWTGARTAAAKALPGVARPVMGAHPKRLRPQSCL
jgi:hypothetical protein